jgi:hypothetical protein
MSHTYVFFARSLYDSSFKGPAFPFLINLPFYQFLIKQAKPFTGDEYIGEQVIIYTLSSYDLK